MSDQKKTKAKAKPARDERLKKSLRANLQKRKAQARARTAEKEKPSE